MAITRNRNEDIEKILDNEHYQTVGGKRNRNELESYEDVNIGTIVFNITNLPRHRCEEFRSIATIEEGELFQSKLDRFAIYRYTRDEEQVAVTLNQNIKMCGRLLYRTGIQEVYVMLIEEDEQFLENKKLKVMEYEEGILYEAELRGVMNSLELSTDELYMDINYRICKVQRRN